MAVKAHCALVYNKLQAESLAELVHMAGKVNHQLPKV